MLHLLYQTSANINLYKSYLTLGWIFCTSCQIQYVYLEKLQYHHSITNKMKQQWPVFVCANSIQGPYGHLMNHEDVRLLTENYLWHEWEYIAQQILWPNCFLFYRKEKQLCYSYHYDQKSISCDEETRCAYVFCLSLCLMDSDSTI